MTTPNPNAPELLHQEILEEARRRKEGILAKARQEAAAMLAKAQREAEQYRRERLAAAQAEAAQRTEAILATVPVEAGRARSARIEELLEAVHDRARERLRKRAGIDYRTTIARLSAEALKQMAGGAFRLRFAPGDRSALGDGLLEEASHLAGRPGLTLLLAPDADLKDGEVLLESEGGRQVWNLGLEARLARCWPELRRQIGAHSGILERGAA